MTSPRPSFAVIPLLLLAAALIVFECPPVARSEEAQKKPLNLKVTLSTERRDVTFGGSFWYSFEIQNFGQEPAVLMDPTDVLRWRPHVRLLLFDKSGNRICDLLEHRFGRGSKGPVISGRYWMKLPAGGIVGGESWGATLPEFVNGELLLPGSYSVQLVFLDMLASANPYNGLPDPGAMPSKDLDSRYYDRLQKWLDDYPGKELVRSNAVELEIVPRTGD